MGSRFQFQIMTEGEARAILSMDVHQAEFYPDKLRAVRRLMPVASPQEIENNKAFLEGREPRIVSASAVVEELRAKVKPSGPWFTVTAGESITECRSCRAPVYWVRTAGGKAMMVDCDVNGGNRPNRADPGKGVSHMATCPTAHLWRKEK